VTSFWAGQEGSFLLWLALAVLLGLWVKAKAKDQLGWVMFFFLFGELFLLSLLMISSPFKLNAVIPPDGKGLNPLLQNFWMQIHPPIIFLGFAATFVPFAFAMASLATNKYDNWVRLTFPWAILSVFALGTGTILGGYWAYETLGWGGYWAWDPVENASLVPWLTSIALIHGMVLERKRGTFRKTNLFMAITTFLVTIYGTFLTRSGVLADFSVHSFVDLGYTVYLVIFLTAFTVVSYGLLFYRMKSIRSPEPAASVFTKEFALYLGMLFLILSGFLVLIGMSAPLLTRIWGEASAVPTAYYVLTNLPIGIIIGLVLGMTPLVAWGKEGLAELRRKMILPLGISIVAIIIAMILGIHNFGHLLFVFAGVFAFVANLVAVIEQLRIGQRSIQANLVHTGVGLMFIGIIISSAYSSQQKIALATGENKTAFGFNVKFTDSREIGAEKLQANLIIDKGSTSFAASPVFMQTSHGLVRNPFIKKFLFYDLYISPEEIKSDSVDLTNRSVAFAKGQTLKVDSSEITFQRFDLGSHMGNQTGAMSIGAVLTIKSPGGQIDTVTPVQVLGGDEKQQYIASKIPGTNKNAYLLKINADQGMIVLGLTEKDNPGDFEEKEKLILDISLKPMINLVWLGVLIIIVGTGWSAVRRIREV
jgi:cytochrome c-type biogenesis protein CcmF